MKIDVLLNLLVLILGIIVAIAPHTFAPVCMIEMRCWFTRDVETILGAAIAIIGLIGAYRGLR
ncbi:MAG: DUF4418 family protein [Candidatus Thorarchaeota archaeon]|nr:DUF4418 family protein [Candidatus Thorarchaeota archaeon]